MDTSKQTQKGFIVTTDSNDENQIINIVNIFSIEDTDKYFTKIKVFLEESNDYLEIKSQNSFLEIVEKIYTARINN